MDTDDPSTQTTPYFARQGTNASGGDGLSTTQDDGLTNQQLNKIATDMGSQSDDLVTALDAIATAINAKPSA